MQFFKQLITILIAFGFMCGSYAMETESHTFSNTSESDITKDQLKQKVAQFFKENNIDCMDLIVKSCCLEHISLHLYTTQQVISHIHEKFDSLKIPYSKVEDVLALFSKIKRTIVVQSLENGEYIMMQENANMRTINSCKNSNNTRTPTTITTINLNRVENHFLSLAIQEKDWQSIRYDGNSLHIINNNNNSLNTRPLQANPIRKCSACHKTNVPLQLGCPDHTYCEWCFVSFMHVVFDCFKCQEVNTKTSQYHVQNNSQPQQNNGKQETTTTNITNTSKPNVLTTASKKCDFCNAQFTPYASYIIFCKDHSLCRSICESCYPHVQEVIDSCNNCKKIKRKKITTTTGNPPSSQNLDDFMKIDSDNPPVISNNFSSNPKTQRDGFHFTVPESNKQTQTNFVNNNNVIFSASNKVNACAQTILNTLDDDLIDSDEENAPSKSNNTATTRPLVLEIATITGIAASLLSPQFSSQKQEKTESSSHQQRKVNTCYKCFKEIKEEPFSRTCCNAPLHKQCYDEGQQKYSSCPACWMPA